MAVIKREVEFSKEADELGKGLVSFVAHIKSALADGWSPGSDLPAVISAVIADLVPAIDGVAQLGDEFQQHEKAFAKAFADASVEMLFVFKK